MRDISRFDFRFFGDNSEENKMRLKLFAYMNLTLANVGVCVSIYFALTHNISMYLAQFTKLVLLKLFVDFRVLRAVRIFLVSNPNDLSHTLAAAVAAAAVLISIYKNSICTLATIHYSFFCLIELCVSIFMDGSCNCA